MGCRFEPYLWSHLRISHAQFRLDGCKTRVTPANLIKQELQLSSGAPRWAIRYRDLLLPRPEPGAQWVRGQRIQSARTVHPIPANIPAHPDLHRGGRLDRQWHPGLSRTQGVWTRRQPVYYDDFMRSEEARIEHWDYKLEGWSAFRQARPNAVHEAVVDLERAGKLLLLVTQNIDGLHARAGTSPERLVELHGTNLLVECQTCHRRSDPEPHFESFRQTRRPPRCECGGFLKPATISFGQSLVSEDLDRAGKPPAQRTW
jgi:hypothetical protein